MTPPVRKWLHHDVPKWVDENKAVYFITICCAKRGVNQLAQPTVANAIFETLRKRFHDGVLYPHLALLMPDHLHAMVSFGPGSKSIAQTIRALKSWIARTHGIQWQSGFFQHRLRSDESSSEKYEYICANPVRAGLVATAADWPWKMSAGELEMDDPTERDRPYRMASSERKDDRADHPYQIASSERTDDRADHPYQMASSERTDDRADRPYLMGGGWTAFRPLGDDLRFTPELLAETLDGGQAFRWRFLAEEGFWQGVWNDHVARIRTLDNGCLEFSEPIGRDCGPALRRYLGSEIDWDGLVDALPWRSDTHLETCLKSFPGLRLLQQAFPETLLAFLCSATKQIPQIKIMCDNLARSLGSEILPGTHALPSWEQVAGASETDLRALGLGFRAKNIKKTADALASQPSLIAEIEGLPYAEAKAALVTLPGVGEKIADCALLFGAGCFEAFPVDTWILKALERRYGLDGWKPAQVAQFGRAHFGPAAGFAQQFLFSFERRYG